MRIMTFEKLDELCRAVRQFGIAIASTARMPSVRLWLNGLPLSILEQPTSRSEGVSRVDALGGADTSV